MTGHAHVLHKVHTFVHSYAKEMEKLWGVSWACTNVLMHVHILTKVWDQKTGDWDMHAGPQMGTHVCTQLCKWDGADSGSQVDMYTCTDACAYSN